MLRIQRENSEPMTTRASIGTALTAFVAGLCLIGCYSNGVKQAERSTPTLGMIRDALNVARWEVGTTLASLNQLAEGDGDLDALFEVYMSDCESLEAELSSLRRLRLEVSVHRETFARERLLDGRPPQPAGQSLDDALSRLYALESKSDAVRDLFNPWFSNLKNIGQSLGRDLDAAGLAAVAEQVELANETFGPLEVGLGVLIADIDAVARITTAVPRAE
jgi:hypothetical protein